MEMNIGRIRNNKKLLVKFFMEYCKEDEAVEGLEKMSCVELYDYILVTYLPTVSRLD